MSGAEKPRLELVDVESGEVVIASTGFVDDPDVKGWVLRWRTAHKRRTGGKLKVVGERRPAT